MEALGERLKRVQRGVKARLIEKVVALRAEKLGQVDTRPKVAIVAQVGFRIPALAQSCYRSLELSGLLPELLLKGLVVVDTEKANHHSPGLQRTRGGESLMKEGKRFSKSVQDLEQVGFFLE